VPVSDGRNRLAACKLAGVKPTFETRPGDPTAFILSQNIKRRHMTAGQRAMATAMLSPETAKGGRGLKSSAAEGFSTSRLSYARTVLRDQALAERVLAGTLSLDDAYDEVRRDAVEQRAGKRVKLARGAQVHADSGDNR
jgi:hypothetical protein